MIKTKKILYATLIILSAQCRERYEVPYTLPETGYLVVEGYINGNGRTTIKLSRTSGLSGKVVTYEEGATVRIEGEDNSDYPLLEADSGRYISASLNLDKSTPYRVWIAAKGKEYASAYTPVIQTAKLDSISWKRQNGGVEIFVNARDPQDNTRYYKWDHEETWEFKSSFYATLELNVTEVPNGPTIVELGFYDSVLFRANESIYTCWQNRISRQINIGSTAKLAENVVYQPIAYYPESAWELSYLYSIRVMQHGLSRAAYEFYEKMKKNTESLGSVFDAQPSEIKGNIICLTDPEEQVVGYVEASLSDEKRIYISNEELPRWNYYMDCRPLDEYGNSPDQLMMMLANGILPTTVKKRNADGSIGSFNTAPRLCVDCTLRGTNIKPSFWP